MKPAIALAILVLLASGCEQGSKTEPAQKPPAQPAPADTAVPAQRETSASHPIASYEIEELRKQGLSDPITQIVQDLRSHPEVIPHPALGGTMGFYDPEGIRVLSSRWVYARFDDGHIAGDGIFEFEVQPGGRLSWSVVSSRLEQ